MTEVHNPANALDKSKMKWQDKSVVATLSADQAAILYETNPELNIAGFNISSPENEKRQSKLLNKLKQQPFIPAGICCTIGALILGLREFANGNQYRSQIMMRYRVGFQAFTVCCIAFGMIRSDLQRNPYNKDKDD